MNERQMQASIMAEAEWRANQDPRWAMLFAIPNGQYREGQRMEPGLKAGVPDLFLPVASRGFHGLFMELKVGSNGVTATQGMWHRNLHRQGYYVSLINDEAEAAIRRIEWYLGEGDDE